MHTSLFSRTCFGKIPWKNCGGEWDKTLGRWNKSPTRQELVVTLPRDCCSQTSCHTNRLVHEGALQKKKKRITIKLKPHESTNQRKSLTLVFEVQSHQIPRRLEAGYERGELTSQWTCAERGRGGGERTEYSLKLIIYHIKDPVVKYQKQEQQVREGNTRVTHV